MATRSPIQLSDDVIEYIRGVFAAAGDAAASRMERQPNVHEEFIDMTFVDAVAQSGGPHRTESDTVVDIDIHFVGGGWHYEKWEVADIGLIVTFRRQGEHLRTKTVLLQSKRLYPREAEFSEDHGLARPGGMGHFVRPDHRADIRQPRLFTFDGECRYKALQVGDNQWSVIRDYESKYTIPVHYLLYHPGTMPYSASVPAALPIPGQSGHLVGARVLPASLMRATATEFTRNYAPSFSDLSGPSDSPGQPIAQFVADDVLGCREGYVPEDFYSDAGVNRIFNQRTGPIAAAIAIFIDLPSAARQ